MRLEDLYNFINEMVDSFVELCGDRLQFEDKRLVTGLGWIGGKRYMIIAVAPKTTKHPDAALRKGVRMVKLAEQMRCDILLILGNGSLNAPWNGDEQTVTYSVNELVKALLATPVTVRKLVRGGMDGVETVLAKTADTDFDISYQSL